MKELKEWCKENPCFAAGIAFLVLLTLANSPAACFAILGVAVIHELVELYKFDKTEHK